jgi:dihydroflavonol-4-reductase
MDRASSSSQISSAFVTGATGLLGNHLVRLLVERGVRVRALVRSPQKAEQQFAGLPVEIVVGDMSDIVPFAGKLCGVDVLFHTAAYFRDSYKGGSHRKALLDTNVRGTAEILSQAYSAGVRRVVHTSSVNVLAGPEGALIDERMSRAVEDADDYSLSKILSDREVVRFLQGHRDMSIAMVLPGWMIGPGDMGPTSSGQLVLDFLKRKLPGIPPTTMSVVDARDVAEAMWAAAIRGRSGERYIAAGRHTPMEELFALLEEVSGVPSPRRSAPFPLLYALAVASEAWRLVNRKPVLISVASVQLMRRYRNRTHFDDTKSERELGVRFRPLKETLRDTVEWYRQNGWCDAADKPQAQLHAAGGSL